MGWSTYFAFILAAINTLTVTYFLAVDNYPALKMIFPSFEIYVLIIISIGVPLLIFVGYSHYKKTKAFRSEMDILVESNPFLRRTTVNTDIILRFNVNLINLVLKLSKDTISEDELNDMKKIQKEVTDLIKNRSLFNNLDIDYINKKIREKSDYMV
jgi:amino acid permease